MISTENSNVWIKGEEHTGISIISFQESHPYDVWYTFLF